MKRADLIRYIEKNGCEFLREGSKHTVYIHRTDLWREENEEKTPCQTCS